MNVRVDNKEVQWFREEARVWQSFQLHLKGHGSTIDRNVLVGVRTVANLNLICTTQLRDSTGSLS